MPLRVVVTDFVERLYRVACRNGCRGASGSFILTAMEKSHSNLGSDGGCSVEFVFSRMVLLLIPLILLRKIK